MISTANVHVPPETATEEDEIDNDLGYVTVAPRPHVSPSATTVDAYRTPVSTSPPRLAEPEEPNPQQEAEMSTLPTDTPVLEAMQAPETKVATVLSSIPTASVIPSTSDALIASDILGDAEDADVVERLWRDMKQQLEAVTQARLARERQAIKEKLESLTEEITALRSTSSVHERECQDLAQTLPGKEQELLTLQISLQQKDDAIRTRDVRISQLQTSLRTQGRHKRKLEANVKKMEDRDRIRAQTVQAELDGIKRRISVAFTLSQGEDNEEEGEDELAEDEPPAKRSRLD